MALAIFDLDNTLIAGDSDYLWGEYLCEQGIVDAKSHTEHNDRFYEDYKNGTLDIDAFLQFQLSPLAANDYGDLLQLRKAFMDIKIAPIMLDKSRDLIEKHRQAGDFLLIITATNQFITKPIAERLTVDMLIATMPEFVDGQFTGRVSGTPSFAEGKVARLHQWLQDMDHDLDNSWFYSDSYNDLPLLNEVSHAVAVDPDDRLKQHAKEKGWPIISLRD